MTAKNRILGTLAGTVVLFLLGWVFYGMLLMDFYANNVGSAGNVMRADEDMIWWALILGNLFQAYFLVYVFSKFDVTSFGEGLKQGIYIGLILGLGFNLIMYGTSNMSTLTSALVDPLVSAVMTGLAGGVIAVITGKK
jgi:hypothetical protein